MQWADAPRGEDPRPGGPAPYALALDSTVMGRVVATDGVEAVGVEAGEGEPPIRVLLVDDHAVVRRGLRGFFELLDDIEIVGEAEDGQRAVELVDQLEPDVVLMDLLMPVLDGIGAT